jgi:hypothetical protein
MKNIDEIYNLAIVFVKLSEGIFSSRKQFVKEAGLFEPPPAMFNQISAWMRSIYAAHTWAIALEELTYERGEVPKKVLNKNIANYIRKGIKEINAFLKWNDGSKIVFIGAGLSNNFSITNIYENDYHVVYVGERQKGHFLDRTNEWHDEFWEDISPNIVSKFKKWVKEQEDLISALPLDEQKAFFNSEPNIYIIKDQSLDTNDIDDKRHLSPNQVEKLLLIRECKRYASAPKKYVDKAVAKFPINLKEWKYTSDLPEHERLVTDNHITVILNFKGHRNRTGIWKVHGYELEVDVPYPKMSVVDFKKNLNAIEEILAHELRHAGQDFLEFIKKIKSQIGAGLPSKKIRDLSYTPWGVPRSSAIEGARDLEHSLHDTEFYTNLADSINEFKNKIPSLPANKIQDAAKQFVGLQSGKLVLTDYNFDILRQKAPKKWKMAVKLFWKELDLG